VRGVPVSLGELAVRFGCELRGDPDTRIERVATLATAEAGALSFLANPRYRAQLSSTHAAAVVLSRADADACRTAVLVCENPYATYARIAALLYPGAPLTPGVHPSAVVAASAHIDPSARVAALASVGEGVRVGPGALVGPHCSLAEDVALAADVQLVAHVTLGHGVLIGARTVVQPGVVIGGDGFGFAAADGGWVKVPQLGTVRIGADVEIGANTTIDRGAIEDTVIEDGVKLDNLIMVGHNTRIGAHTVIAGCTGISGSVTIGKRCVIGGAVGIAGHISIADDVVITGYSAISHSIALAGVYSSTLPAEEAQVWRRLVARFKRGEALGERVRRLERAAGLAAAPHDGQHD
jgi:UDP-3-O-[3-hydroxymyristoyl] glucosamine N-acyltransferase